MNSMLALQNFTTARKGGNILLTYVKSFFVLPSSEYETSGSDRKVDRNIYPDAVIRDRMRLIGPRVAQEWPIRTYSPL